MQLSNTTRLLLLLGIFGVFENSWVYLEFPLKRWVYLEFSQSNMLSKAIYNSKSKVISKPSSSLYNANSSLFNSATSSPMPSLIKFPALGFGMDTLLDLRGV